MARAAAAAATADEAAEREGMGGTDAVSVAAGVPHENMNNAPPRSETRECEQRRKERRVASLESRVRETGQSQGASRRMWQFGANESAFFFFSFFEDR